ncbi:MAG TPA: fatty acid desaturase [Stellaceae bacterium]|nr:fatty acid desaturase [Stellaceae bacterium]
MIENCGSGVSLAAPPTPQAWGKRLARYAKPDGTRAVGQLLTTAAPLLASAAALFWGLSQGFWPAVAFAVPAALFVVRLFVIQHDCGHGSYFRSGRVNNALGRVLGVVTMMPYAAWRRDHAVHHASSGNLERRGIGDVTTLTVAEYRARSRWQRLAYRFYRHPLVLFVMGPAYMLMVRYRIPMTNPFRDGSIWLSILGTNVAAAVLGIGLAALVGPVAFLAGWGTMLLLATTIGVWFFYVQHQFEDTYWRPAATWNFHAAALQGSSYYDLPRPLHWLTGSIGFHHIHHLASRIPNYRLRACFEENPELHRSRRVTLWGSLNSARLALWDEETQKLVSFRHAARAA